MSLTSRKVSRAVSAPAMRGSAIVRLTRTTRIRTILDMCSVSGQGLARADAGLLCSGPAHHLDSMNDASTLSSAATGTTQRPAAHPAAPAGLIGVLLVNLGTPDATDYWSMR